MVWVQSPCLEAPVWSWESAPPCQPPLTVPGRFSSVDKLSGGTQDRKRRKAKPRSSPVLATAALPHPKWGAEVDWGDSKARPSPLGTVAIFWLFLVCPGTRGSCFKGAWEIRGLNCSKNKILPWITGRFAFLKSSRKPPVIVSGD